MRKKKDGEMTKTGKLEKRKREKKTKKEKTVTGCIGKEGDKEMGKGTIPFTAYL